jgi:GNAT superfamily N-acetyltransferase
MGNYEIIPYQPALKDEVVELRRHSYETEFAESGAYLEWKYERNPYIAEPIFHLARAGGKIIGMRGLYGTRWEFGDKRESTIIPCADDFAVVPEHRNTGIMTRLLQMTADDLWRRGYSYVMNSSGGPVTVFSSLVAGWKSVGAMEPVVRRSAVEAIRHHARERLRRRRFIWRLVRRSDIIVAGSEGPFRRLDRTGPVAVPGTDASIVVEAGPRPEQMAALIDRLPYDGRIRHVRDAAFFAWRYANPIRQHRFLFYQCDGRLEGYLALARYASARLPILTFHLVDWEGSPQVKEALLRCAVRAGGFPELGAWTATLSAEDRAMLARAGFVPTELSARARGLPCVLLKKLGPPAAPQTWKLGAENALDLSRWDMRLIYSMHG